MDEASNEIQIFNRKGDPLEQLGRLNPNTILGSAILGTPKASFQNPNLELVNDLKEKLKNTKTKGEIEVHLGHTPFFGEMKRLFQKERRTNLFLRLGMGIQTTLALGIMGKLGRIDHYNPFTETVHVYHPNKAVALHEVGHALDYDNAKYPGLKMLGRFIPPIAIKQEWTASRNAMQYLDKKEQKDASKILEPAIGTYAGVFGGGVVGKLLGAPAAIATTVGSIALGHMHGRSSDKNIFFNGEAVRLAGKPA